jgi:hypothetical protein
VLVGNTKAMRRLEWLNIKREKTIKMYLRGTGCGNTNLFKVAQAGSYEYTDEPLRFLKVSDFMKSLIRFNFH